MDPGFVSFVGACLAILVGCLLAWKAFTEISAALGIWLWLGPLIAVAIPAIILFYFVSIQPELRFQKRLRAAPKTGPMRVNIRTEQFTKGLSNTPVYRLHIDVQLCQKDMLALKKSGMDLYELFPYPHPKFPDQQISYRNVHLYEVKYVDFPDIQTFDKGKDDLMNGLHFLRSRFDQTTETLQVQEHAPKNTSETYEI